MKIVVGLGNPGAQYQHTKHNVGFMVVDKIALTDSFPDFTLQAKFKAEVTRKDEVMLVKPQTFMNRSGESVSSIIRMYKDQGQNASATTLDHLLVVHDDLDLELGNWKIQLGTGPKIHNGLLSLYEQLGTQQFWHVRVGVDTRQGDRTIPSERYVLMPFTQREAQTLAQVIDEVAVELASRIKTA